MIRLNILKLNEDIWRKKRVLEDEIASLKTEIATLSTTRQQQQEEIYKETESLKLQRRDFLAQKKN